MLVGVSPWGKMVLSSELDVTRERHLVPHRSTMSRKRAVFGRSVEW